VIDRLRGRFDMHLANGDQAIHIGIEACNLSNGAGNHISACGIG